MMRTIQICCLMTCGKLNCNFDDNWSQHFVATVRCSHVLYLIWSLREAFRQFRRVINNIKLSIKYDCKTAQNSSPWHFLQSKTSNGQTQEIISETHLVLNKHFINKRKKWQVCGLSWRKINSKSPQMEKLSGKLLPRFRLFYSLLCFSMRQVSNPIVFFLRPNFKPLFANQDKSVYTNRKGRKVI